MKKQNSELILQDVIVHYMLSFKHLCLVTVLCPLAALFICFITAYIFQYDDIHETHCRVRFELQLFLFGNETNVLNSRFTI